MTWTGKLSWFLLAAAVVGSGGLIVYVVHTSSTGGGTVEPPAQTVPAFEPKTEAYYLAHRAEMKAREDDCTNRGISPFADTPEARDCNAAAEASKQIFFGPGK
ncbi:hypothetical protein [Paraburkholderia sediminicola]|uniref:hypothetical protein n=1 Tax=Paraburkholderia sediminicola TaxID=458836 RepID=UPI0038B8CA0D